MFRFLVWGVSDLINRSLSVALKWSLYTQVQSCSYKVVSIREQKIYADILSGRKRKDMRKT